MSTFYYENGVNASILPGTIIPYIGSTAPAGWALCDGSPYSSTANPNLHAALGSPANANLPNLGAAFLRGSGAIDASYNGGTVRGFQEDTVKKHTHAVSETQHTHTYQKNNNTAANSGGRLGGVPGSILTTEQAFTGIQIVAKGDFETRPFCYGVNYIIKLDDDTDLLIDASFIYYLPFENNFVGKELDNYSMYYRTQTIGPTYSSITPFTGGGGLYNIVSGSKVGNSSLEITNVLISYPSTTTFNCNYLSFGGWVSSRSGGTLNRFFNGAVSGSFCVVEAYSGTYNISGQNGTFGSYATGISAFNDSWIHVFVVLNGATRIYYINGVAANTLTGRTLFSGNQTFTFILGRSDVAVNTCRVDDLRAYSRALTANEVLEIYYYRDQL